MTLSANILITGATGFVGSHLVKALLEYSPKIKINVLIRKTSDIACLKRLGNIHYLQGDLEDKLSLQRSVEGVNIVFHLAGMLGKHGVKKTRYCAVNTEGTRNLLEACLEERRIRQFIYLSSAGVLGPNVKNADETYPLNPSNIYERTKAEAEKIVFDYYHKMKVPVTVLRPEFLYGSGDWHVLGLFKAIKNRRFFLIDGGQSLLHPTYIEDIVQALLACCGNEDTIGETYLIAGERSIAVKEFAGLIAKYLGAKCINKSLSTKRALILARFFELSMGFLKLNPPLTVSRVKFFTQSRSYNISKAKKDLGLSPLPLEEGVIRTVEWYKSKGYL